MSDKIRAFYDGEVVYFEHGAGIINNCEVGCGSCHVDHAHIHLLLLPPGKTIESLEKLLNEYLLSQQWFEKNKPKEKINDLKLLSDLVGDSPYLMVGGGNSNEINNIYQQDSLEIELESQLMRKLVATLSDNPQNSWWHWRDVVDMGIVPERAKMLSKQMKILQNALLA